MKKYRIIEDGNGKFRVEKIHKFLFWKFWMPYNPYVEATEEHKTICGQYCGTDIICYHKKYSDKIIFDSESEAKEITDEINYRGHTIQKFYTADKKPVYLDLNCKMFWNYYRFGKNIYEVYDKIDKAIDQYIKED